METKSSMSATLQTANLMLTGMNAVEKIGETSQRFGDKVLIVTDSGISAAGIVDRVRKMLEDSKITVNVFDQVEPEPDIQLVHRCVETIKAKGADF